MKPFRIDAPKAPKGSTPPKGKNPTPKVEATSPMPGKGIVSSRDTGLKRLADGSADTVDHDVIIPRADVDNGKKPFKNAK